MAQPSPSASRAEQHGTHAETIKETLISIVIAFTMAFVFRGFVIEAFVIPTGSMAPTLMGAHMQFHSQKTGENWPVGAIQSLPNDSNTYFDPQTQIAVPDPITGEVKNVARAPLSAGDRILVLKYLYTLFEPERFDVIVFKNPTDPSINYIKRLIGLPGEQVALIDGDVFVRTPKADDPRDVSPWSLAGWTIARKPHVQQRAMWQNVYDSAYEALSGEGTRPWRPSESSGWNLKPREYAYTGGGRAELIFDQTLPRSSDVVFRRSWEINDQYPYNTATANSGSIPTRVYPVSDVRVRTGIRAEQAGLKAGLTFRARNHEFIVTLSGQDASIQWRAPAGGSAGGLTILGAPVTLASGGFAGFEPGRVTDVEVWHADQRVTVFVDGKSILHADYDWTPDERLKAATGMSLAEVMSAQSGRQDNYLAQPTLYAPHAIRDLRLTFDGSPFTLYRVGLDRDIFYQPVSKQSGSQPGLATSPMTTLTLSDDQFFPCGDNSPASLDGRLLTDTDDWVLREFPGPDDDRYSRAGVIPRELLMGKAFFVYWPSLLKQKGPVPVVDFGRMRFIW